MKIRLKKPECFKKDVLRFSSWRTNAFLDFEAKERQEKELLEEKQQLEQALSEIKAIQSQFIQSNGFPR